MKGASQPRLIGTDTATLRSVCLVTLLVTSIVVAGCSGFTADSESTTGAPDDAGAAVTTADTPTPASSPTDARTTTGPTTLTEAGVDPERVWTRTERLLDVNATMPSIEVVDSAPAGSSSDLDYLSAFAGANSTSNSEAPLSYWEGTVHVDRQALSTFSAAELRGALAHEYTHAIQFQRGWVSRAGPTTHSSHARLAQVEGMAVYVQSAYERRYVDESTDGRGSTFEASYANGSARARYHLAPYVFGDEYYERTVSDPAALSNATRLPLTTEQVLHDTDEGPTPLSIRPAENVTQQFTGQYRGEIATRIVLRETLNESRAAAAADGWGNDRTFEVVALTGDESGHVWIHRWDSPAEADEFAAAAREHLDDRRAETDDYRFGFVRIDENRTAMLAGNEALLDSIRFETHSDSRVVVSLVD